jgi:hypothetical protein
MRGTKVGPDDARRPVGVDKSLPPDFILRGGRRSAPGSWWSGLTSQGKWTVCVALLVIVGAVAGLSAILGASGISGGNVKPHPPVVKPPVNITKPRVVIPLYSFSNNTAKLDIAVLASGLHITIDSMSSTSKSLNEELSSTYGLERRMSSGLSASLDVLADGPDTGAPDSGRQPNLPSDIGQRYVKKYRAYLATVNAIQKRAQAVPPTAGSAAERTLLLKACADLSRDTSAIVAGLERLGTDSAEDSNIAHGIEAASGRIVETAGLVDRLLGEIDRSK